MADAVVLEHWDAADVRLGTVAEILIELRHSAARTASRTLVMTLVLVAVSDDEIYQATEALHRLGARHPARLLVLRPDDPSGGPGIDARIRLYGAGPDARQLIFDETILTVHGGAASHLDTIAEPFTVSDLPVVVWYPAGLPSAAEPLLTKASTLLVDTKEAGQFTGLVELAARRPIVDLSWERLRPWREMLAALFDGPVYRPLAAGVSSIEIDGKPGPRRLLAGWLSSRLGTPPDRIHLKDARHVSIRIHASHDGAGARLEVTRYPGERLVRAGVTIQGGPSHHQLLSLPDDSLAWSLGRALTHLGRDRVWEQALPAALRFHD